MQARDASALLLIFLASVGSGSFGIWTHYDSKAGWDSLSDGYSSSGSAGPGRRGFGSGTDFESISFSDCEVLRLTRGLALGVNRLHSRSKVFVLSLSPLFEFCTYIEAAPL